MGYPGRDLLFTQRAILNCVLDGNAARNQVELADQCWEKVAEVNAAQQWREKKDQSKATDANMTSTHAIHGSFWAC